MQKEKLQFTIVQSALVFLWAAILILFLCRCGEPGPYDQPDFYTELGTRVFLNGVTDSNLTRENVSYMQAELIPRLRGYGLLIHSSNLAASRAVIHLEKNVFPCTMDMKMTCGGEQADEILRIADSPGCPWHSSIRHELTHLFQQANGLPPDYAHDRQEWTDVVNDATLGCYGPGTPQPQ